MKWSDLVGKITLQGSLALFLMAAAVPAREVNVPEPLRPWKAWVLDRNPAQACPVLPDGNRLCVAYGSLDLDLGDKGGSITQAVTVFGRQWVVLPGDADAWPLDVRTRAGANVAVVLRDGRPQAQLPQGEHVLAARLAWPELPGALGIPGQTARVALRLRGKPVIHPDEDGGGRLLLESKAARPDSTVAEVPLTLRVYRKLIDDIPMRLETQIRLAVSGGEREILTGRLLPEGATVIEIESDLPVRVEADGRLRAQLLPGDRSVRVVSRYLAPIPAVSMERMDSLWPAEEVWTFEAHREIRVVELAGAQLIDPSQTGLPEEWKSLPAYRLAPQDTLRMVEKQRGDPSPQAGTLQLTRQIWLDFSGKGFTQKDFINGQLFRRSRLEMRPGFDLGRAELDGSPVMISALGGGAGVEVPAGDLNMVALSRMKRGGRHEATGWNYGFQGVQATLNLPPGWKLLHAEGPDRVSNSWISGWSLWDIFLLCILTLAVLRLAGWQGAVLALITFVLLSQESGLDGLLWLNLLAALGLCKVLPPGKLLRIADVYRWASLILLAVLWIPFAIVHVRKALYPQLDGPGGSTFAYANTNLLDYASGGSRNGYPHYREDTAKVMMKLDMLESEVAEAPSPQMAAPMQGMENSRLAKRRGKVNGSWNQGYEDKAQQVMQYSKVQTGPGEPAWGWESAGLSWSGPVQEAEALRLFLMPPWISRVFRASQAVLPGILLLLLGFSVGGAGPGRMSGGRGGPGGPRGGIRWPAFRFGRGLGTAALLALLVSPARGQFPGDTLLKELEQRLLAPPECHPGCVGLNSATVGLAGDRIRVSLFFDAVDTAVATLPQAGRDQWALDAIRLDDRPASAAVRLPGGALAAVVPKGRHRVTLEGRLMGNRLELVFGDDAHNLAVDAPGFSVQGLAGTRAEGGTLVFQRHEAGEGKAEGRRGLLPDPVLPFVLVHRTLDLAQEWILDTRVVRVAPGEGAFSVEIPLLPFEHPLAATMARDREKTLVSFQEGQGEASWRSTVDRQEVLKLTAGDLIRWAETWQVTATSRWHLETGGLAPIQAAPGSGQITAWQPIPGDSLLLRISEPKAALGPVKTVENAILAYSPGRREGAGTLTLSYRAGQGDAAKVVLPPGARLDNLSVNGNPQPLTQREGTLTLPLQPGLQSVVMGWKQAEGIRTFQKTPRVELGDASANVSLNLSVPRDRWVLFVGGPSAGPALLLWGVLVVLIALAFGLGRSGVTPFGFLDWALLFAGTSTVNVYTAAPLLVLFLLLRYREKEAGRMAPRAHNLMQVLLAMVALIAFGTLVSSVPQGLLSAPDMQITGNGSSGGELRWFMDRADGVLPVGWMFSVPLWTYRVAMLAWSLWLAFRLLRWLRWSWDRFSTGGIWKESHRPPKSPKPTAP